MFNLTPVNPNRPDPFFRILGKMVEGRFGKEVKAIVKWSNDDDIRFEITAGERSYEQTFSRSVILFSAEAELASMARGCVICAESSLLRPKRPHAAKYLHLQPLGPKRLRE